ncbi:hypothetical protein SteCoe_16360 [Stentor coeruleus]|uniref:Uncharacterized protein n=1 Tax=Stentor coeruleus TaxID=5963 RepID=A0A1R2C1G2_9CILI|nr:hypothetical protein SteCoe_16360 [Stentor coeruleus]
MKLALSLFLLLALSFGQEDDTDAIQVELDDDESEMTLDDVEDLEATDETVNMNLEGMWELNLEEAGSAEDSTADEIMTSDLLEELRDLEDIYEDMENFETVTIDGIEYTKEEIAQQIEDLETEIHDTEVAEAALDVDILYYYLENPGNILDYNEAMEAVDELLAVMNDEDIVTIDSVEYNKQQIEDFKAQAEVNKNNALLQLRVDTVNGLVIDDSEDSVETLISGVEQILFWLDDGETVEVEGEIMGEDELNEFIEEYDQVLYDMDEGKELEDQIEDVAVEFLKEKIRIDDYTDENEEIEEVMSLTEDDVEINGEIYTSEALQAIIDTNLGLIQDLQVAYMAEDIMEVFLDKQEAIRLSSEDYEEGIALIQRLVDIMDSTDVVVLDSDEYTQADLIILIEEAENYSDSQNLLATITSLEENIFSDPPTSEEIEDEIVLLEEALTFMDPEAKITIDGVTYSYEEIEALVEEYEILLVETLNNEALQNELGDVQFLLDMFEGTATAEDLELLIVELEELQAEMEDGDTILTSDGDILGEDEIGDIIEDTEVLLDQLEDGEEELLDEEDDVSVLSDAFLA